MEGGEIVCVRVHPFPSFDTVFKVLTKLNKALIDILEGKEKKVTVSFDTDLQATLGFSLGKLFAENIETIVVERRGNTIIFACTEEREVEEAFWRVMKKGGKQEIRFRSEEAVAKAFDYLKEKLKPDRVAENHLEFDVGYDPEAREFLVIVAEKRGNKILLYEKVRKQ